MTSYPDHRPRVTAKAFADYVQIDNDLPVSADMTDDSICAEMQVAADSGESGDEAGGTDPAEVTEGGPTATFKDAVQNLRMLRGYT